MSITPIPDDQGDVRASSLECPKCHAAMRRIRVGEIDIDRCQSCEGIWLDALEKEKLLRDKKAARRADSGAAIPRHHPQPRILLCPRDKSRMIRMVDLEQPRVGFESCTVCGGTFLDAGELSDLSETTLSEWLHRVVPGA